MAHPHAQVTTWVPSVGGQEQAPQPHPSGWPRYVRQAALQASSSPLTPGRGAWLSLPFAEKIAKGPSRWATGSQREI